MVRKKQDISSTKNKDSAVRDLIARLHPSLRMKFVPLPKAGEQLTDEQLLAIFSGDLDAFRDVIQLIRQTNQAKVEE